LRPVLVGVDGLRNSVVSDLVLRYSPQYYHFVANSSNVVFNNIDVSGFSKSTNVAKNTDGWDTYRSEDITIMNSVINNGDGEFSFFFFFFFCSGGFPSINMPVPVCAGSGPYLWSESCVGEHHGVYSQTTERNPDCWATTLPIGRAAGGR
jgi:hypothetical protein